MKKLNQCLIGEEIKVISINQLDKAHQHQLATLGVRKQALLKVTQVAPLGDPICIEVQGAVLALRKHECEGIMVEKI